MLFLSVLWLPKFLFKNISTSNFTFSGSCTPPMMERFHRAKLAIIAHRCYASKIMPKISLQQSPSARSKPAQFSSIFQRFGLRSQTGFKRIHHNPFLSNGCRRFYSVDHFKPGGTKRWFRNHRIVLVVFLVGSGVFMNVDLGHFENVPFTDRKQFVLWPTFIDRTLEEFDFKKKKNEFEAKGEILPPTHPESVRVRLIARKIIEALQRRIRQDQVWKDTALDLENADENLIGKEGQVDTNKKDKGGEIFDDKWVQQKGSRIETFCLDGLKWEVLVVDKPDANVYFLPRRKIVVYTGLLNLLKTDAEIATVISREVGHAVARHSAEGITKSLWLVIAGLILELLVFPNSSFAHIIIRSTMVLIPIIFWRLEIEADKIGLLLMASAGYDPRVAPQVYEKSRKKLKDPVYQDDPSTSMRAKHLTQTKVMDEAIIVYGKNVTRTSD